MKNLGNHSENHQGNYLGNHQGNHPGKNQRKAPSRFSSGGRLVFAEALSGSRGVVSIQFLFALTIVLTFSLSFFQLCIYLVQGSKAQYLTYSAARSLFLGDRDRGAQEQNAKNVYDRLRDELKLGALLSDLKTGHNHTYMGTGHRKLFYGVWTSFNKGAPGLQIPFVASSSKSGAGGAAVGSYLGREPSQQECWDFNKNRAQWICGLYPGACDPSKAPMGGMEGDNGC